MSRLRTSTRPCAARRTRAVVAPAFESELSVRTSGSQSSTPAAARTSGGGAPLSTPVHSRVELASGRADVRPEQHPDCGALVRASVMPSLGWSSTRSPRRNTSGVAMTDETSVRSTQATLRHFAYVREWQQFHDPKNLVMALAGEAGELLSEFQWLTPEQAKMVMADEGTAARVRDEVADVGTYLLRLCDVLDIDLLDVVAQKVERNEQRYPMEQARGNAEKYTRLQSRVD